MNQLVAAGVPGVVAVVRDGDRTFSLASGVSNLKTKAPIRATDRYRIGSVTVELGLAMKLLADSAEGVGYLLKDRIGDVKDFLGAVRRVAAGGSALDPIIVSTLLSRRRSDDPLERLTPREREVLGLMAAGSSNRGIAEALVITLRAVEKYVSSIFGKLGLPSSGSESRRVLAVLAFLRS